MSWKGFTKAVNRAGTSIMQTAGAIDKTIDRDFEDDERRLKKLESKVDRLAKESKGYLDALRALSLAQTNLADTIDSFYDDQAPCAQVSRQYKSQINHLDDQFRSLMGTDFCVTVLDPLNKMCDMFPVYNSAIKKRNHKLLDYDNARSKHRKLVDKPSDDPTRVARADEDVIESKRVYEALNVPLKEELPKVLALRTTYIDPSFEALVKLQYMYYSNAQSGLEKVQPYFMHAGVPVNVIETADRQIEGVVEQVLSSIRSLPIVTGQLV